MDGWIIYNQYVGEKKNNACQWMVDVGKRNNLDLRIKYFEKFSVETGDGIEIFYEGNRADIPKFAIMRGYDEDLGQALELLGVRVFNSTESMEYSRDKWKSHLKLSADGIKNPRTIKVTGEEFGYEDILEKYGHPFVLKERKGSKGDGVFLIRTEEEFEQKRNLLKDQGFICQEFIRESSGVDYRVHVIGGKAVASIRRSSADGFRSNYFQGGSAESAMLTKEHEQLAVSAANALGLEIAGVDIIEGKDGALVCEVNGNAGFVTVWKYSEISIPDEIMKYVSKEMN